MSVRAPIEQEEGRGSPPGPPEKPPSRGALGALLFSFAVILAVAGLVVGIDRLRGPSSGPAPEVVLPPGETTVTPTTAADPDAAKKAEVIAAYRAVWDALLAVGRDSAASADDERLSATRTGDSLVALQRSFAKTKEANDVLTGEVKLSPVVVELTADTAIIRDCLDDATGLVDAKTGEVVEPPTRVVAYATVKMKLVDGVWKQANFRDEKVPCTPAAG